VTRHRTAAFERAYNQIITPLRSTAPACVLVLLAGAATLVLATPGLYFLAGMAIPRASGES